MLLWYVNVQWFFKFTIYKSKTFTSILTYTCMVCSLRLESWREWAIKFVWWNKISWPDISVRGIDAIQGEVVKSSTCWKHFDIFVFACFCSHQIQANVVPMRSRNTRLLSVHGVRHCVPTCGWSLWEWRRKDIVNLYRWEIADELKWMVLSEKFRTDEEFNPEGFNYWR
jgi:hypothetical protein